MFKIFNALQGSEKNKEAISGLLSSYAPLARLFSNRFQEELKRYGNLKYLIDRFKANDQ